MRALLALAGLVALLLVAQPPIALAQARIALLIGNQKYNDRVGPLRNPHNDVALVGGALKQVGFDVLDPVKDAGRDEMLEAVHDLGTRLRKAGRGAVGFLYYTGHGVSSGGENVLVPANAPDTTDRTLAVRGVKLGDILDTLKREAPDAVYFVVVDACRNNLRGQRGTKGFVPINDHRTGMVLAFATAAGDTASDEGQVSGPYAEALATELVKPGQTDQQIFNSVRAEVVRKTRTQVPWTHDGLIGERVVFKPAVVVPPPATVQTPVHVPVPGRPPAPNQQPPAFGGNLSEAAVAWERIRHSQSIAVLEAFIRQFPDTVYSVEAQERIAELRNPASASGSRDPALAVAPGSGRSFRDCPQCPEMVVVPAGRFDMGSPESEHQRTAAEGPRRNVNVELPFAIGKTEVTKGEFAAFVAATGHEVAAGCYVHLTPQWKWTPEANWREPGYANTDTHPVSCVNWQDATAFVKWLSTTTGKPYRLLTEAEWELAARAGSDKRWTFGDDSTRLADFGWFNANSPAGPQAVGRKRANAFGIHDMHGNVWEWVEDCWHADFSGAPSDGRAWKTNCTDAGRRVIRGGSWQFGADGLRSAFRGSEYTDYRLQFLGFRVARTLVK